MRAYRARMRLGLERCRLCGVVDEWGTARQLTLDHIYPRSQGGTSLMGNATILCVEENGRKGDSPPVYKISLAEEEMNAPKRQRWSKLPIPRVPPGPWDVTGHQPPRTRRGYRRALEAALPEWAVPYYSDYGPGEIPDCVKKIIAAQYADPAHIPGRVRYLLDVG